MARASAWVLLALVTLVLSWSIPAPADEAPTVAGWTEAERWAWEQIRAGRVADFNARYGETLDPAKPEGWASAPVGKDRRLSAFFLSTILLNPPLKQFTPAQSIAVSGAWFPEGLDLSLVSSEGALILRYCRFERALRFTMARIKGLLFLQGITAKSDIDLVSTEIGALTVDGGTFSGPVNMFSLSVGSHLLMQSDAKFGANLDLTSVKVGGGLAVDGGTFSGPVNMTNLTVGSHLFVRNGAGLAPVSWRGEGLGSGYLE